MVNIIQSEITSPLLGALQVGIIFRVVLVLMSGHDNEQTFAAAISHCKKLILAGGIGICLADIVSKVQGSFGGNNLFDGMKNLFVQVTAALVMVETVYTVFMLVTNLLAAQQASAEEQVQYRKRALQSVGIGIMVTSATGLLSAIFRYF